MTPYSIWIVSPPGYRHSRCFEEVALALSEAFAALGLAAPVVTDPAAIRGRAIVLGANLLSGADSLPPGVILYNLEQIRAGSPWLTRGYVELLRRHAVWDYSPRNIERLADYGVEPVALCGIGYMPALTRIAPQVEDIDVLFVGSLNERRRRVLEALTSAGRNVRAEFDLYGDERDALIARARLVLNLHFYESQVFEIVRVSYLLANRKCVVSESGHDTALEEPLRAGVAFAAYDDLAGTCLRLLNQPDERARLAARGYADFSASSQVTMLKRALGATVAGG